ncbi:MAG: PhpK family radical SAM P-methyltransferase [Candidatus Aminicenantes bacterium]|nr:PhpK family radical SAM P-methyltransferase [Candidatus Aminicenantes bacterium]NIM81781.1 PhpK family radical SAM P-methyltransferase [Candidatus Aminicenantes bacterium]NIN21153.1 PhpK family radical SAM P-methyltransferase [Candidatus Aminicenantes bacterium]NIN44977.1 PhpK family radical SAM P-methyltransferase [Candidatus Aminicenantes bacterium]NIN87791.1 PhpK family radical SAM P-methyltransferase [Candidatus Aminicenantes bacterium]
MSKMIDCFFIGHNEMSFVEYEKTVREMGIRSGAYRQLEKSFLRYDSVPYHASEIFNIFGCNGSHSPGRMKPLTLGDTFNLAIAYLGTYLHRRNLSFDYVNAFQDEKEVLGEKLAKGNVLIVAIITTLYVSVFPILEVVRFVKKYNNSVKIIIGGPFISNQVRALDRTDLESLFKFLGADVYVNSSQGEAALVKIIYALKNNLLLEGIDNIYYNVNGEFLKTSISRENNRLSENMVNWDLFSQRVGAHINIRTSISCPFSCKFCGFPEHAGQYQTTGVEEIEEELNRVNEIDAARSVHFIDDTFNVPTKRFKEILKMMIKNNYKFKWHSHFRCQFADRETVELMKESGCEGVILGIESGSNKMLKLMNKASKVEQYLKGIELLKSCGILMHGNFFIGFPGETLETVDETVRFIKESGIDFYNAQLWYCDTITPIWREREKFAVRGSNYEWRHATMDSQEASNLIDKIFSGIDEPIWVPQYNFESDGLFHLLHRGLSLEQVKNFIKAFNKGIREKIIDCSRGDVSFKVIKELEESLRPLIPPPGTSGNQNEGFEDNGAEFDF